MALDLYAGIRVSDYETAKSWYGVCLAQSRPSSRMRLRRSGSSRSIARCSLWKNVEGAGGAIHTIFAGDLDALVAEIASRGIEPDELVTYPGKARKAIYRDADRNEIGFGGAID